MIPSPFFRQQQQQQNHNNNERSSASSDDDETDDESNDKSFYHNPYHSSGLMNYVDVPQQQYTNEHTYPTYLAQQQTSDATNQTLDDQIHAKLLLIQHRRNQFQTYANRNRMLPTPNMDGEQNNNTNGEALEEENMFYSNQDPNFDEQFDLASVVLWYRNVMQSVKKIM